MKAVLSFLLGAISIDERQACRKQKINPRDSAQGSHQHHPSSYQSFDRRVHISHEVHRHSNVFCCCVIDLSTVGIPSALALFLDFCGCNSNLTSLFHFRPNKKCTLIDLTLERRRCNIDGSQSTNTKSG